METEMRLTLIDDSQERYWLRESFVKTWFDEHDVEVKDYRSQWRQYLYSDESFDYDAFCARTPASAYHDTLPSDAEVTSELIHEPDQQGWTYTPEVETTVRAQYEVKR